MPENTTPGTSVRWYTPRAWHGMTLPVWLRLWASHRFALSPRRIPLALSLCAWSAVLSFGKGIEELLHGRQTRRAKIEHPPLFILGHWRTGTTLLHELLIRDEQFIYPTTYQCLSPHNFLHTTWIATHFFNFLLPERRPMDNMAVGWQRPQEDEFALGNLGLKSPYLCWAYPECYGEYDRYLDLNELSPEEREHWRRVFVRFLTRVSLDRPGRLVLKSPTHTARVRTLLEIFPDAQFIHIVRNPYEVFPSTVHTWERLEDYLYLKKRRRDDLEDYLFGLARRMYDNFERDRAAIPQGNLCEVRFEELVIDPLAEMQRIYGELSLGDFAAVRPALAEHLATQKDYQRNKLELPEEQHEKIARHWADYIQRYGYADEPAALPLTMR